MGEIQLCFKGNLATSMQDMAGKCMQRISWKGAIILSLGHAK